MKQKYLLLLPILLFFINQLKTQTRNKAIDSELSKLYQESDLVGFSVAIVNLDSVQYLQSFGFLNLEDQSPLTVSTRQNIASISKTFIGIALMKLVEENKIDLSTPINEILSFKISNPKFPNTQITIEQLASHTSSIEDYEIEKKSWYLDSEFNLSKKEIGKDRCKDFSEWDQNKPQGLGVFLKEALSPDGKYYTGKRFTNQKPGSSFRYSNIGAALAAYIIELKTGMPYSSYIGDNIFKDLDFTRENWKHTGDDIAASYFQNKLVIPIYRPILYPTGGMMLTCKELSFYLNEIIKGYNGESEILSETSFKQMMSPRLKENINGTKNYGLFWELNADKIGHNGGNYGVVCFMSFNKNTNIGKIFMTNISSYENDDLLGQMIEIWKKLGQHENDFNKKKIAENED